MNHFMNSWLTHMGDYSYLLLLPFCLTKEKLGLVLVQICP